MNRMLEECAGSQPSRREIEREAAGGGCCILARAAARRRRRRGQRGSKALPSGRRDLGVTNDQEGRILILVESLNVKSVSMRTAAHEWV